MDMPQAADRVFISIGVSKPGGGLEELPGAIRAAERMAAWADAQGYLTVLIHDRKHPEVTIDLLREEITAAIAQVTDTTELKRLVVFFAGHGAALDAGDQYWILTRWNRRSTEAVKVSSLQRVLEYYGPRQVAIIGDACQEFSAKFINLVGSPVLDIPDEDQRRYELDQFFAVDAGKQAFMIKATNGKDDFCLFTEVLLDALEGDVSQEWFDRIGQDMAVTSQSLARYLVGNVAQEAGKYGVRMNPLPRPGFYTDCIYFKKPPPATATGPKSPSSPGDRPGANEEFELAIRTRSVEKVRLIRTSASQAELVEQTNAIQREREAHQQEFIDQVGRATVRDHFETGCGICVSGGEVAEVQASFGEVSRVNGQPNWFRIQLRREAGNLGWSDALVTLADGRVCSVCAVEGFVAALHILGDTSLSLFHRPIGAGEYEGQFAIDLLAKAHAGLLSQNEIIDAAAFMRHGKHRIITLGCISAQFYDTIRDVGSLRSMASFYAQHGQPVPLDIVLYGGGRINESEGRLYAEIPMTPARQPRTPQEQRQSFTFEATPGFGRHPIAGRIPWMRHAWGAVMTASCDKSAEPWRESAVAVMAHLAPGSFTNVSPDGREALLELAGLEDMKPAMSVHLDF
jgi:Caspase domain